MDEGFYAPPRHMRESLGLSSSALPSVCAARGSSGGIGCEAWKIQTELNHYPPLRPIAWFGMPTILSSGVSTLADIDLALRISGRPPAADGPSGPAFHCVTSYPCAPSDYNLRVLAGLSSPFRRRGCRCLGPFPRSILVPALSIAAGGSM